MSGSRDTWIMFTGLVESIGRVVDLLGVLSDKIPAGRRLRVLTDTAPDVVGGESVSINGVCLTAVAFDAEAIAFDVSPETLRVTTLGDLTPGSLVNIERS